MRIGDDEAVAFVERGGDALQLGGRLLAAQAVGVQDDGRAGRRRSVGPDGVDRIAVDGHEFGAGVFRRLAQGFGLRRRVQPRIVADAAALRRLLRQPAGGRGGDEVLAVEQFRIDLFARLDGVAAVDENRRLAGEHDRRAGRAGEAGQPREALGAGRDVFVLMLVGARNNEAIEAATLQFVTQRGEPWRGARGIGGFGKGLEAGFDFLTHAFEPTMARRKSNFRRLCCIAAFESQPCGCDVAKSTILT